MEALEGLVTINGADIWKEYGAFLTEKKKGGELQKAKKNAEYLAMLERADEQVKNGQVVVKTMEELIAMEE